MRFSSLFLLSVFIGCASPTGPQLGDEFQLQVGEHVVLRGIGAWVAFGGVSEDSRCASQAMCVWAGDAAVLVETAPYPDALEAHFKTDTLHTNLDPKLLSFGSAELVLIRLEPYPETTGSIPADAYVATFKTRPLQ